ncbi:GtrA family protein [Paenibacillus thermotolerans]|uniref:GtrA family protein n=1 Tax=Paenibacillus thermotolerans TaxID=3027807 RepID=UPI002367EA43|nr:MULTISPECIES: GtrA family protein [unclassified Paenibacillus]
MRERGIHSFFKFGIVGALNTGVDIAVFAALTAAGAAPILAQVGSYACGFVNSFAWNKRWTFRSSQAEAAKNKGEGARFLVVNLVSLAAASAMLELLYTHSPLPLLTCKLFATGVSLVLNYIGSRYWVFPQTAH